MTTTDRMARVVAAVAAPRSNPTLRHENGGRRLDRPRPHAGGKFVFVGDDKLYVRGATYGAFHVHPELGEYYDAAKIDRDFALMAANGMNAVRIPHTMPPPSLLDAAERHGLLVMVGLSAEHYVGYLTDKRDAPDIEAMIRTKVRDVAGHRAILCYALGNEIPATTARWLGPRRVEKYLRGLYQAVKDEDPDGLVTYVNYPTTEYLDLSFLDLLSFNVYLEDEERLRAYLKRLHNLAGDRPLIMSEVGLDSLRNGEDRQADVLEWQIRTTFEAGCAGAFVFSWTDEWYRGSDPVEDWEFGLTRRDRSPKPALAFVRDEFAHVPFRERGWPKVSVVVCTYNGNRTIRECLEGLANLDYPDFEVIVVDDGSTEPIAELAAEHGFRVIRTDNEGLSNARNVGLREASGEIVAYIDDDAFPDRQWLTYLAHTFATTDFVGVGGPNIPPADDETIAQAVAHAPGGPIHVLLSDDEAEHIPGCNMAFRKTALEAVGGFDPQFRIAGDDVDICWRLQEHGWKLGFNPAASVWHRRRNSVRAYWRQQRDYGKAEGLLERKWPEKYNGLGHVSWGGRLYGSAAGRALGPFAQRIYHGFWGTAPFQSVYRRGPSTLTSLPALPEWYLLLAGFAGGSALGFLWKPLLLGFPLLAAAVLLQVAVAVAATTSSAGGTEHRRRPRGLTFLLHLLQPLARLRGRLGTRRTPWRWSSRGRFVLPRPRSLTFWIESWRAPVQRVEDLQAALRHAGVAVGSGGDYDQWDLEARSGAFARARIRLAVEDHGTAQYVRLRVSPLWPPFALAGAFAVAALASAAALDRAWVVCGVLAMAAASLAVTAVVSAGALLGHVLQAGRQHYASESAAP